MATWNNDEADDSKVATRGRVVILVGMRMATQTLVTTLTKVQGSVAHGKALSVGYRLGMAN